MPQGVEGFFLRISQNLVDHGVELFPWLFAEVWGSVCSFEFREEADVLGLCNLCTILQQSKLDQSFVNGYSPVRIFVFLTFGKSKLILADVVHINDPQRVSPVLVNILAEDLRYFLKAHADEEPDKRYPGVGGVYKLALRELGVGKYAFQLSP